MSDMEREIAVWLSRGYDQEEAGRIAARMIARRIALEADPQLPWKEYQEKKRVYDLAYQAWKDGGSVGALPPRPIPPHTPGRLT